MTHDALVQLALQAMRHAHAPYSGFRVGAALLCGDGAVYTGCNIENASYGLTNCAERTALFKAVSEGQRDFSALAVVADGETPAMPCGACRQALAEFCEDALSVYCCPASGTDTVEEYTLGALLPHAFRLGNNND